MSPQKLPVTKELPVTKRDAELVFEGAIERGPRPVVEPGRQPTRAAIEAIGKACRLTPGEMRVLHAVVEVGRIRDIAVALAVSQTTVKTHLRHIFQKTHPKGQIDLIRLIVRTASSSAR